MQKIRVLVVDDHAILRDGIDSLPAFGWVRAINNFGINAGLYGF